MESASETAAAAATTFTIPCGVAHKLCSQAPSSMACRTATSPAPPSPITGNFPAQRATMPPNSLAPSPTLVVNPSAFSHTAKHLPSSPANDSRVLCPTGSGALARVRKSAIRRWKDRKAGQEWPQSQRPSEEHARMHARTATLLLLHLKTFLPFYCSRCSCSYAASHPS